MTDKLSNRLAKADDLTNNLANNLTDNEIIKALENEINLAEYVDSDYCTNTEVLLLKSTIDLINRQKAEIERLQKDNSESAFRQYNYGKSEAIEAIREFAERLKAEIKSDLYGDDVMPSGTIDWLVRKMTEQ